MTPTRRPFTDDPQSIPHSGMCDAGKVTFARRDDGLYEPIQELCTCGAGLLRMLGGRA